MNTPTFGVVGFVGALSKIEIRMRRVRACTRMQLVRYIIVLRTSFKKRALLQNTRRVVHFNDGARWEWV